MKLSISVNFDFNQLNNQLDKLVNNYAHSYAKNSAEGSRAAIDRGVKPGLKPVTHRIRKSRGQKKTPPLKASGKLYNSIRAKKNKLVMLEYGKLHHDGLDTETSENPRSNFFFTDSKSMIPNKLVRARPFIKTKLKNKKQLDKGFVSNIKKNLKSKITVSKFINIK